MATIAYALTTKEKVKEFLGITGTTNDSLIDSLINYITDFIESYVGGRRFKETPYTNEEYDLPNGNIVFIRQFPLTELTSAQYLTGSIASPVWVSFTANDFQTYLKEGYVKFFSSFASILAESERALRFTYKAGYKIDFANELSATHTLPFDIAMVATQLVSRMFNLRTAEGIKSESTEGQSITYDRDTDVSQQLTIEQKATLEKYKKHKLTI